jgi:putative transposase
MSAPKHRTAPGSSYFVTTRCWQGRTIFHVPELAQILIKTMLDYRQQGAYLLHEFVVMPDHLHLILTPSSATSLEKAVQLIKGGSSHRIHLCRGHKMEIWQKSFGDRTIRDVADWQSKVEYIRMNSARAKLVERPEDWPQSSASGSFELDPTPAKFLRFSSRAKAQIAPALSSGQKPRPPEEKGSEQLDPVPQGLEPNVSTSANVGPKGPTPNSFSRATNS